MLHVHNVSKLFKLYGRPFDRMWDALRPRDLPNRDFWALRDVDVTLRRGEILGIIGPNGSGKSTLLQVVAGVLQPTKGRVSVRGRVAALLELGAGFNPEFTGRENVLFSSELLGKSRAETLACLDRIQEFADIGDFIDRPVKEYSSGMYVRLAFSAAIHVQPDVLLVDEALAVGDAAFSNRCFRKLDELRDMGVSILFVSHDLGIVKRMCHRAVLMHRGRIIAAGSPADVVNRYIAWVHEGDAAAAVRYAEGKQHGDAASRIDEVDLVDDAGHQVRTLVAGQRVSVRVRATFRRTVDDPVVGMLIRNPLGVEVYGTNTRIEGVSLGRCEQGDAVVVNFEFPCSLARHEYTLTVATQYVDGRSQDWRDDALVFRVTSGRDVAGVADLGARVGVRKLSSEHEPSRDPGGITLGQP